MLNFYADFSGKEHERLLVAAGYLATERRWKAFSREWSTALKDAGVKEFHATDFFSCHGEFDGWKGDRKKHTKYAKRFTAIAGDHPNLGIAYGLTMEQYRQEIAPDMSFFPSPKDRITGLMFCGTSLLIHLGKLLSRLSDDTEIRGQKVAVVFELEEGIGNCIEYWSWLKKRKQEAWMEPFVSFTPGSKELFPLQGADLAVHESWRRTKEHFWPEGRQVRKSLQRLLRQRRFQMLYAEPGSFRQASEMLHKFLAAGGRTV